MHNFFRRPSGLLIAGAITTTAVVVVMNDKYKNKVEKSLLSYYRIGNLLSTVTVMSVDYGLSMYYLNKLKTNDNNSNNSLYKIYEDYENKLKQLQTNQELYTINQINSKTQKDIIYFQNLIIKTRYEMDYILNEMAKLSEKNNKYSVLHTRNAIRMRNMCLSNGGVYIKLGQHISMLDHIIPPEYQLVLSSLLNNTTRSSYESIRKVFFIAVIFALMISLS